jgi:hypothetical protein
MCILRYTPSRLPSASTIAAEFRYTPRRLPLEDRNDEDDLEILRQRLQRRDGRSRDGLGQLEPLTLLRFAEVLAVEELLQADDLCAFRVRFADLRDRVVQIRGDVGVTAS